MYVHYIIADIMVTVIYNRGYEWFYNVKNIKPVGLLLSVTTKRAIQSTVWHYESEGTVEVFDDGACQYKFNLFPNNCGGNKRFLSHFSRRNFLAW